MKLSDEIRIEAPVATVFAALNDPNVLMACIPGCEELLKRTETEMDAKVVLKIGPYESPLQRQCHAGYIRRAPPVFDCR